MFYKEENKAHAYVLLLIAFFLLTCLPIKARAALAPNSFQYPTESWLIDKQDYFGAFLEWDYQALNENNTFWRFTWCISPIYRNNPLSNIIMHANNNTFLKEIFKTLKNETGFSILGDFLSDCKRLGNYPVAIQPDQRHHFLDEPVKHINLTNAEYGNFTFSLKEWRHNIILTIGFKTTITYSASTNILTAIGGAEGSEITHEDLYNADLAAELELMENRSASYGVSLDKQVQPADNLALKLRMVISEFAEGSPINNTLWVDDFNFVSYWFMLYGASPWLAVQDFPDAYIGSDTGNAVMANFTFEDVGGEPTEVIFWLYCWCATDDDIEAEIWDGSAWQNNVFDLPTAASKGWVSWNLTAILDSSTKVNNAEMRLTHIKVGGGDLVYADASFLEVITPPADEQVVIRGMDKDNVAQTETVEISANGNVSTSLWFRSVNASGVDAIGSYYIAIYQLRWGVLWQNVNAYYFDGCRLRVGNGSTRTWFRDNDVTISFDENSIPSPNRLIEVLNNASFELWNSYLYWGSDSFEAYPIWSLSGSNTSLVNVVVVGNYTFLAQEVGKSYLYFASGANAILDGVWLDRVYLSSIGTFEKVEDLTIRSGEYGSYSFNGVLNDTIIEDCYYGMFLSYGRSTTTRNVKIRNSGSKAFLLQSLSEHKYLINPDVDEWDLGWAVAYAYRLYQQYEYDLNVTDSSGAYIENANVTLRYYGQGGGLIGSWLTYADSTIPTVTISKQYYNSAGGNTPYSFEPIEITVTKEGYATQCYNFTINEKTHDLIILEVEAPSFIVGIGAGVLLASIIVGIIVYALADTRKR